MNDYNTVFDSVNHTISGYWEDGTSEVYKVKDGKATLYATLVKDSVFICPFSIHDDEKIEINIKRK